MTTPEFLFFCHPLCLLIFYSCDFISSAWLISIMYQIICIKIACGNIWGPRLCYLPAQSTSVRSHWALGSNDYQDLCLVSKAQMAPSWVPVYGGTAYCLVFWRWPADCDSKDLRISGVSPFSLQKCSDLCLTFLSFQPRLSKINSAHTLPSVNLTFAWIWERSLLLSHLIE